MANVAVKTRRMARVAQGDVFRDVELVEYVTEKNGVIEVSKIVYPLVVVLTQDCDLEQDARYKAAAGRPSNDDKRLVHVLVAPMYNAEQVYQGTHLTDLQLTMAPINKNRTPGDFLRINERPRYHYFDFTQDARLVSQIIDFKHYFSVNLRYLEAHRKAAFVCRISDLFREELSQRFTAYMARIGLPEVP